ncbi:MAG: hypothetical protein IT372_41210, partial [Polyangiaceae bacterium]|nr:hypothetical protein [Polyangiaceae bacterium]
EKSTPSDPGTPVPGAPLDLPVTTQDLLWPRGLDISIRDDGSRPIVEARVAPRESVILTSALCIGLKLDLDRGKSGAITFHLDDPP